jgi:hypothetical protein
MQAKRSSSTKRKGSVCLEQVLFHAAGNYPNTIGEVLMCLYPVQMRCVEFLLTLCVRVLFTPQNSLTQQFRVSVRP